MVIGILNFGEGLLGVNYLIFSTIASLGALQLAASQARLVGMMLLPPNPSKWLGTALVVGAFAWFFTFQPDLFIPGLAGGELFTLFVVGFVLALLISLSMGIIANRVASSQITPSARREHITLRDGFGAELWLQQSRETASSLPLVLALREAGIDSLDVLASELVASGAAVLLCDRSTAEWAVEFVEQNSERFNPGRWYAMGVGRGAEAALELVGADRRFRAALALAPYGRAFNARPGLRWLREMDYLTALRMTFVKSEPRHSPAPSNALVLFGDEDLLIRPEEARELYPGAVMIAGARHFTLGRMQATYKLASDLIDFRPASIPVAKPVRPVARVRGEAGE